jgi:hypothetical protein
MSSTPKIGLLFLVLILVGAPAVLGQTAAEASRDKTKERLSQLLQRVGPSVKIDFQPSSKSPYVFTGALRQGLTNSDFLEVVISVTASETISFRIFPHFKGGYINIDKARNTTQLLRQLVHFNQKTFLFWGADETGDVFTGYTFTLESGFPDEAIKIVLSSIKNSDQFVGEMRPSIDGSIAP